MTRRILEAVELESGRGPRQFNCNVQDKECGLTSPQVLKGSLEK